MITYVGVNLITDIYTEYKYKEIAHHLDDYIFDALYKNIEIKYPNDNNLLLHGTEFGPQFDNTLYEDTIALCNKEDFDNVFIVSIIEDWCLNDDQTAEFLKLINIPNVFKIGNFDDTDYQIHFTWGVYSTEIWGYEHKVDDLILKDIHYKFLNYNRNPKQHRVELVNMILERNLNKCGIVTLGNDSALNTLEPIEENINEITHADGRKLRLEQAMIPNDNSSLGTMKYWNHHFLNVVGETRFWWWDDIFVTEKTAKPMLGLRPFIINGNWKIYKWLEDNGFKTFEKYFPFAQFRDLHEDDVHPELIKVIKWVCDQSNEDLLKLYNKMLPDLLHNRNRMFEFAKEEKERIKDILL